MTDSANTSVPEPQVAAVVVTYNRKNLLRQCLEALHDQTYPIAELIVVDNASTDGTAAMVRSDFPDVTLRVLDENQGGAGGFHEGMKMAASRDVEWIWVMDDDAEPEPTALEALFRAGVHEESDTVALTPLKQFPSGRPQYDQTGWYDPVRAEIEPVTAADEVYTEITYGAFVGLLCRTDAVERIGLPEAAFFLWYDDVEYCLRLADQGRLYLIRQSRVTHHVSEEMRSQTKEAKPWRDYSLSYYWRLYYSYRNRFFILYRHEGQRLDKLRGTGTMLWKALRSIAMVLVYHEADTIEKIRLVLRGVVDGLLGRRGKRIDPERYVDSL